jgi:hypothetical protein
MSAMTKKSAVALFDTQAGLARAVGLSAGRISQWPELLTQKQADLVMGAALRLGKLSGAPGEGRECHCASARGG